LRRTGAIGARIVPVLVTLVLATWDQRLPDRPSGVLASRLLKRKGNRRETEGERNRTSDGRRDGTGERRTKGNRKTAEEGEEPSWATGKPEESPDGT